MQLYNTTVFKQFEERLTNYRTSAATMYSGQQHLRLMDGTSRFQERRPEDKVDLWILSAGYGLIPGKRKIVPYECTFQGMRVSEIRKWARHLRIPQAARALFSQPADLVVVLLGNSYLRSLALDDETRIVPPTLFFASRTGEKYIKGQGKIYVFKLTTVEAKRFSCGLVGLKGEVAKRLLLYLEMEGEPGLHRVLNMKQNDLFESLDSIV